MTRATFSRIIEGIRSLPTPVTVFFGGFGEPLAHPEIIEMVDEAKSTGARVELITNGTLLNKKRSVGLRMSALELLYQK
jgi:MoaA/NifB/PqqE/SkfB family radical SAM enzyme